MNIIKNIQKLTDLKQEDIILMEQAALAHLQFNAITFKVISTPPEKLIFLVAQGKSPSGNQFDAKRLIEIVHETFDRFFPGITVHVQPKAYVPSPVDQVDPEWIKGSMDKLKIGLKQISHDTGIDYTRLSSLVTGNRPLSQSMKALFYYYFTAKEKQIVKSKV